MYKYNSVRKLLLSLGVFSLLFSGGRVQASPGAIKSPTTYTIPDVIQSLTNLLGAGILLLFLGIIIYGGFTRMTAAGDEDKEKKSMQILTAGVIGFIIIALAPTIIRVLGQFLGISNIIG